jgi:hypothetical protein
MLVIDLELNPEEFQSLTARVNTFSDSGIPL